MTIPASRTRRGTRKLTASSLEGVGVTGGLQPEVADLLEARRQHVLDEAVQELDGLQSLRLAVLGAEAERNSGSAKSTQACTNLTRSPVFPDQTAEATPLIVAEISRHVPRSSHRIRLRPAPPRRSSSDWRILRAA